MDIYQFLDKNIAVVSTLLATLLGFISTLIIQIFSNKSKLKEMSHQTTLKIKEMEYSEKKKTINEILNFLQILSQPSNFSVHTTQETGTSVLLGSRELITKELSKFYVNYAIFMSSGIQFTLNELTNSLMELEEKDFDFHRQIKDTSAASYEDNLLSYCNDAATKVFLKISNFKDALRNELSSAKVM
ncbi:TPA: hypothetical protein O4G09_005597 [Klebsiella michiganensis]|uniref:hypothetical protein n=1 Tax=Klebsiella pasteurii TaxID=2587529 RepID=UPI00115CD39B|nr:hypothetical protein [Klebsiella pasteurii]VUT14186.1 hypothetical protein SB6413_06002 [Klebsiella pasteurii]HCZ9102441.1 hypothetical protein [Klebsiella michiganensis]